MWLVGCAKDGIDTFTAQCLLTFDKSHTDFFPRCSRDDAGVGADA